MTENINNTIQDQRTKINKASSSISTSILDRIKAYKAQSKHTLLIDTSGSMNERVSEDGIEYTSKYSIVCDLMTKIPQGTTKYHFTGFCEQFTSQNPPPPSGGTAMHLAFKKMKEDGRKEIILITDGYPDHAQSALNESKGLKIDIIYIGPQPKPDFLEDLARASGGSFTNIDLLHKGSTLELENKVQLLLGA